LRVSGWHCAGCSAATEGAVKGVAGVKSAKADLRSGTLEVTYDDEEASLADLEEAVVKAGYEVERH
jgi:copper chaperone CopZ